MNCPKCKMVLPQDASWSETKNGKKWIKLPNGDWHNCEENKFSKSKITKKEYVCHECKNRVLNCDESDCPLCKFDPSYCQTCKTHVSIIDVK